MVKKVLIIDDNEQDRMIMKRVLGKIGFEEITIAETGEKGIEHVKSDKPSLVILDTVLPGIDGFEVCRQIKEALGSTAPEIIMMTGTIDAVDAVKARKMGANDYCVKTADCSPLLKALKNYLK